ncbi:MAG: hypothetical protein GF317_00355 [Candidatus Lokiarchaeota archaeon]|nr:hypothetical protein [Candidatus Lokiarchaeota archaeon]MBD3198427.1 hypothetical protein [Candidatus Lokiarchaeota archaeon]
MKIEFLSLLSDIVGKNELDLHLDDEEITVHKLLEVLEAKMGKKLINLIFKSKEKKYLSEYILIILNDRDIRTIEGLNTIIQKDDLVLFMPVIAGG